LFHHHCAILLICDPRASQVSPNLPRSGAVIQYQPVKWRRLSHNFALILPVKAGSGESDLTNPGASMCCPFAKDHPMLFLKTPALRRFTATLAATATALALMTAAAVPAHADRRSDDLAKAAAAIAAIAIIGSALNERDDRSSRRGRAEPEDRHEGRRNGRQEHSRTVRPSYMFQRGAVLPAQCAIELRNRRHTSVAYSENCLRRSGIEGRLPHQCEVSYNSRGRTRTAFDQNCMLNSGFRTQGRGRH
jgi:hypothetical protein